VLHSRIVPGDTDTGDTWATGAWPPRIDVYFAGKAAAEAKQPPDTALWLDRRRAAQRDRLLPGRSSSGALNQTDRS
jgi:hypothetical protein